jgi:hypothetical protein
VSRSSPPPRHTCQLLDDHAPRRFILTAPRRARAALDAGHPIEAIRIHLRDIVQLPPQIVDAMCNNRMAHSILAATAPAQLADTDALDALGIGTARYRPLAVPAVLIEGDQTPRLADLAAALPNARTITSPTRATSPTTPPPASSPPPS